MARSSYLKGPNYVHPERDSAVGSRNSLYRDGRDEYTESKLLIDEEVDKILNHVTTKLPPEVLEKLNVSGSIKEVLHNYYNQGYQNMFNRYINTVEDEMAKKLRHLVDKQETENLNKYTPRDVPFLLDSVGGKNIFNTGKVENSLSNIYGHLQGHMQKGVFDLEESTRKMLSGKTDIGGFMRGKFANCVVKCFIRDNPLKPEAVNDVSVAINIPESDFLKPVYHYQAATETIIKDIMSEHILELIDQEVDKVNKELLDSKQDALNEGRRIFEKVKKLETHIGFEERGKDSPPFNHMASKFLDAIKGIEAEIDYSEYDPLDIRENVLKIIDDENIRNRGFNDAVNKLVAILDISLLGYQYIENFKNCRKIVVREYEDTNISSLPDEHYLLSMQYLDDLQLREIRAAYCQQIEEFNAEADKLTRVFEKIHVTAKKESGFLDYEDVANEILEQVNGGKPKNKKVEKLPRAELWDEITFIHPEKNDIEKLNETFVEQHKHLTRQYQILRQRISDLYESNNPTERVIMEQRLDFLEEETKKVLQKYNPFQVFPGLFLEIDFSSIKRREHTFNGMGNVLTQFLNELSQDLADFAYEEYHKKISSQERDPGDFSAAV